MSDGVENMLALTEEPFVGFMPTDVSVWLRENRTDRDLAVALAETHNHTGSLGHELDGSDDCWLRYSFDKWRELEETLYSKVRTRMDESLEYHIDHSVSGVYNQIKPFMLANGYLANSGWWVKKSRRG